MNKKVKKKNRSFRFELEAFYGNPDLYVDFWNKPEKLSDYKYSSKNEFGEALTIKFDNIIKDHPN